MRLLLLIAITALAGPAIAGEPSVAKLPPLVFTGIPALLDAIDIDGATVAWVDALWKPAIEEVVAANPQKREAARGFAESYRNRERMIYRPLIAFQLDHTVARRLDPSVERQLDALLTDYLRSPTRESGETLRTTMVAKAAAINAVAAAPTRAKLKQATQLAQTPDGIALRELNRVGLYYCIDIGTGQTMLEPLRTTCMQLLASPVLARLRATTAGKDLITLSVAATAALLVTVALAHDAGTSVREMVNPAAFTAAGLIVPLPTAASDRPQ